jgi:hypothetical protein
MLDIAVDHCVYAVSSEAVSKSEDLVVLCLGAMRVGKKGSDRV